MVPSVTASLRIAANLIVFDDHAHGLRDQCVRCFVAGNHQQCDVIEVLLLLEIASFDGLGQDGHHIVVGSL